MKPEDIDAVFEYWKTRSGKKRARMDQKRKTKIRMRLEDGYGVDDLKCAIDGCFASEFHQGANDRHTAYNDIELICRDAPHVDRFIEISEKKAARRQEQQRAVEQYGTAPARRIDRDKAAQFMEGLKNALKHKTQ